MTDTSQVVGGSLALAGCAVAVLAALSMLRADTVNVRLHLLAPVSSLAGPLIGAGLIVRDGFSLASGQIALVVVVLALTGPAVTAAIARARLERQRHRTQEPE